MRRQLGKRRVADVEAAVRIGADALAGSDSLIHAVVIPPLHPDMVESLSPSRWVARTEHNTPTIDSGTPARRLQRMEQ